jgi:hypothetical protein
MNPFTEPIYSILESPLWPSCSNTGTAIRSRIMSKNTLNYTSELTKYTNPIISKDLFYVEAYISSELEKFIRNIFVAKGCDEYVSIMNTNPNVTIPKKCSDTFNNFSNGNIEMIRNNIKINNKAYTSQLQFGETIFNNISYTDAYLTSKTNNNDKKQLCQRFADISQLLTDFKNIIESFNIDTIKNTYKDDYTDIMDKYKATLVLRNDLNTKINDLYSSNSKFGNSKLYLDSTVYTSVLWTILATTILFYIFKKM